MLNRRKGVVVHGTWILLAVLLAQAGSVPPLEEQPVRVEYVLLDVVAYDKQGRPVTDLVLDDFKLTESGKKIDIESLDILDLRTPVSRGVSGRDDGAESGPDPGKSSSPGPRYVLLLDFGGIDEAQRNRSFDQLGEFLARADQRPGFRVAVLAADAGELTAGFVSATAAREALARARQRLVGETNDDAREWVRTTGSTTGGPRPAPGGTAGSRDSVSLLASAGPGTTGLGDLEERFAACRRLDAGGPGHAANAYACIRDELDAYLGYLNAHTAERLGTLEMLAYHYGASSQPTFLLLVSPGLEIRPGRAAISLARSYLPGGTTTDSLDFAQPLDLLPEPRDFEPDLRRVVHACVSARVVFHTFDIYSFGAEEFRRADPAFEAAPEAAVRLHGEARADNAGGLAELAEETGGTSYSGKTLKPMTGVLDQTAFLYTLGYSSPPGKPGAYRKIKLKCRRKGVSLLYRGGYFGR
jgi:VWFA-related protein